MAKPLDITGVSTPMAETNTTLAPTDAEILGLNAGEVHFSETPSKYPEARHGTQYHAGAPGVLEFARAVLAKWGAPATASSEPVALPAGMPEPVGHFINVNEPGAPKYEQVSPEYADDSDAVALYTASQVQAMLAQGLAPGWKAVPVEPTPHMLLLASDVDGLEPIMFYGGAEKPAGEFKDRFELRSVWLEKPPAPQPLPQERKPLTYEQIREWWSSENGLEDCDIAELTEFADVVRTVEEKHGITAQ